MGRYWNGCIFASWVILAFAKSRVQFDVLILSTSLLSICIFLRRKAQDGTRNEETRPDSVKS